MTSFHSRTSAIINAYGGPDTPGLPSAEAWDRVATCDPASAVTLVNFFKLHDHVQDNEGSRTTGQTAFDNYAAVSGPCLASVGGKFLLVAPFGGSFIGPREDWDIVAIGTYPNPDALLRLFEMQEYRACYAHRIAACADQRVSLCLGQSTLATTETQLCAPRCPPTSA